jgi:hypothetical protein
MTKKGDSELAPNNFIVIDFENVQPPNIEVFKEHPFKIFIFAEENQVRIPFEIANMPQEFGNEAKQYCSPLGFSLSAERVPKRTERTTFLNRIAPILPACTENHLDYSPASSATKIPLPSVP